MMFYKLPAFQRLLLILFALTGAATFPVKAEESVTSKGLVMPFSSVTVAAPLREVIKEIHVEEGERVHVDQLLVSLEAEEETLNVKRLEAVLKKADFDNKAYQQLLKDEATSEEEALAKETAFNQIDAELGIAKARLNERLIESTLNGVVVKKYKESGDSIAENDPILQILEVDRLLLLFHLEATWLPFIRMGQEMKVHFPERSDKQGTVAKVTFIDPAVDSRSGLFRVRLLLDNKQGLIRPGQSVETSFSKNSPTSQPTQL